MAANLWMSLGLGTGMGLLYVLASYWSTRSAMQVSDRSFLLRYFAGMMVRMMAVLLALTLVLALVPVRQGVFVASLLFVVFLGIILEVIALQRRGMLNDRG
jgi:hypothetical protein